MLRQEKIAERHGLEQGAVTQLVSVLLEREPSLHFEFIELLDPPMPDAKCKANAADVFVEVTHIYGTDTDARYILGRQGKAAPTKREKLNSSRTPLRQRYLVPLNERISIKAAKTYPVSPAWLLIRNSLPL
jgi:hypothetical protein